VRRDHTFLFFPLLPFLFFFSSTPGQAKGSGVFRPDFPLALFPFFLPVVKGPGLCFPFFPFFSGIFFFSFPLDQERLGRGRLIRVGLTGFNPPSFPPPFCLTFFFFYPSFSKVVVREGGPAFLFLFSPFYYVPFYCFSHRLGDNSPSPPFSFLPISLFPFLSGK